MSDANALLISQAAVLRRLWAVEKLTLCLPPSDEAETVLAHGQTEPAIPELADAATTREMLDGLRGAGRAPIMRFDSRREGCFVFRVTRLLGGDRSTAPVPDFYSAAFVAVSFWLGIDPGPRGRCPDLETLAVEDGPTPRVLDFAAELAWFCRRADAVMRDPVTALPGRADFQSSLTRAVRRCRRSGSPMALLLVNPDDLIHVNRRFGRPTGDAVIRQIAERLDEATGHSDRVHRYGGAVFAVTLEDAPLAVASIVARKLVDRLGSGAYLDGELRLGFAVGVAHLESTEVGGSAEVAQELVQRADAALGDAKQAGHGPVVIWGEDRGTEPRNHDRLAGIFTADQGKDYRNMLLLWDTVRLVAESPDLGTLARRAVAHLAAAFEPDRVAMVSFESEIELLAGIVRQRPGAHDPESMELRAAEQALLERVKRESRTEEGGRSDGGTTLVTPLMVDGRAAGALLLTLGAEDPELDASDRIFLDALAGQLAAALERIHLVERERQRQAEERQRLEAELRQLRDAGRRVELVHRSPEMAELLDVVRRVARTDVTVLVSGESGSGKEVVARLVHEMSPRRSSPPIVVDCGAIASSLIDSELFGHERGAYTGAERRSLGRLTEADGGTLILDEIGELPLEVQSKLLRFVQEKQLTPVGAVRPRTVDVRLIAVTHRNLAAEVAAGRFRGDLYHRLNVVHLKVPPLARRPDDVMALAEHFLGRFAERYRKEIDGLTVEAEARVRSYPWPGNVRELENRLLRAVILCETRRISLEELGLADHQSGMLSAEKILAAMTATSLDRRPSEPSPAAGDPYSVRFGAPDTPPPGPGPSPLEPSAGGFRSPPSNGGFSVPPTPSPIPARPSSPSVPPHGFGHPPAPAGPWDGRSFASPPTPSPFEAPSFEAPGFEGMAAPLGGAGWEQLRRELEHQVASTGDLRPPLGTWVADDLLQVADTVAEGVASRGATLLGMPETTYRRRLRQAQGNSPHRSPEWRRVVDQLAGLLEPGYGGVDVLGRVRRELLRAVVEVHGDDPSGAAALMDVSAPTYRRWRRELDEQGG